MDCVSITDIVLPSRGRYPGEVFKWHADWVIDLQAKTATHKTGLIFDFSPHHKAKGTMCLPLVHVGHLMVWECRLRGGVATALAYLDGRPSASPLRLARLAAEAGCLFDQQASFICLDCGCNTSGQNYYMVHDSVWLHAHPADHGMLCLACLASRLDRPLCAADFRNAPVNGWNESVQKIMRRERETL